MFTGCGSTCLEMAEGPGIQARPTQDPVSLIKKSGSAVRNACNVSMASYTSVTQALSDAETDRVAWAHWLPA